MAVFYKPGKDTTPRSLLSKDPNAVHIPYTIAFSGTVEGDPSGAEATFLPEGVHLTAAEVLIEGDASLTVTGIGWTTKAVTVWLSGGTVGLRPLLTVRVTTDLDNGAGGYYGDDVSFYVPIAEH